MGKVKGKVTTAGDVGTLRYTDDGGTKIDIAYDQLFSTELGIGLKTKVSFDIIVSADRGPVAVAVAPINKGDITEIDSAAGTGTIIETESGLKYSFKQNYLKESNFAVGNTVTYNLVVSKDVLYATCLSLFVAR